eukprot:5646834-Amphidinium_carterae.1
MASPSLMMSGGTAAIAAWTWQWTSTRGHFLNQWWLVTNAIVLGANRCPSDSASVAKIGAVQNIWLLQRACQSNTQCAVNIPNWKPDREQTSSILRCIGGKRPGYRTTWPRHRQDNRLPLSVLQDNCDRHFHARITGKSGFGVLAAFVIQAFRQKDPFSSMDFESDAHLLATHNTLQEDVAMPDQMSEHASDEALAEEPEQPEPQAVVPGQPAAQRTKEDTSPEGGNSPVPGQPVQEN